MNKEYSEMKTRGGKTLEQVGVQVNRIGNKLKARAEKTGAGRHDSAVSWDRGDIGVDTGKTDKNGFAISQELKSSDGRYQSDGANITLVNGAGSSERVSMITAHENGAMTIATNTQDVMTTKNGVISPDGQRNISGYTPDGLVTEAASQLSAMRSNIPVPPKQ